MDVGGVLAGGAPRAPDVVPGPLEHREQHLGGRPGRLGLEPGPVPQDHHLLGQPEPPRPGLVGGQAARSTSSRRQLDDGQQAGPLVGRPAPRRPGPATTAGQQVEVAGAAQLVAVPGELGPQCGAPPRVEQRAGRCAGWSGSCAWPPGSGGCARWDRRRRSVPWSDSTADWAHSGRVPVARREGVDGPAPTGPSSTSSPRSFRRKVRADRARTRWRTMPAVGSATASSARPRPPGAGGAADPSSPSLVVLDRCCGSWSCLRRQPTGEGRPWRRPVPRGDVPVRSGHARRDHRRGGPPLGRAPRPGPRSGRGGGGRGRRRGQRRRPAPAAGAVPGTPRLAGRHPRHGVLRHGPVPRRRCRPLRRGRPGHGHLRGRRPGRAGRGARVPPPAGARRGRPGGRRRVPRGVLDRPGRPLHPGRPVRGTHRPHLGGGRRRGHGRRAAGRGGRRPCGGDGAEPGTARCRSRPGCRRGDAA